ncbi:MAG: His/Gly/Thr/Pro-type tRNA ligase C-terminal domain-containing protein, partial [Nitrospirota bacterium]
FALEVEGRLRAGGIRAEANLDNEKIGYKIREETVRKVPYLVIIGDNEVSSGKITVRRRSGENIGPFGVDEFIDILDGEIRSRR